MNVSIIMGRFGQDPELRKTNNDISVTSFSLAVNRKYGQNETTDWIDCVAWRHTAEFICNYFKKGDQILVEGTLQTRSYEDRQGNKRKSTEVLVNQAHFTGSNKQTNTENVSMPKQREFNTENDFEVVAAGDDDLPF